MRFMCTAPDKAYCGRVRGALPPDLGHILREYRRAPEPQFRASAQCYAIDQNFVPIAGRRASP